MKNVNPIGLLKKQNIKKKLKKLKDHIQKLNNNID